ncbi:MAG: 4-(cytidine 5'-diphospho)-2-C-methyl-D-erythritol kinase [Sphingomonadaceae bacterium]
MTDLLTETAYAKINLALHVRARRPDGYHELETLFAFAEHGDRIDGREADDISLTISGPLAGSLGPDTDNLVLRAAHALKAATGTAWGAALHLVKHLPVAAGLGGGSADAAAALRLLARLWRIDADAPEIMQVAQALGADVPACVLSQTCFGHGRGDALVPFDDATLSGTPLLLANPGIALATGPVFVGWDQRDRGPLIPAEWRAGRNDLTASASAIVPEISGLLTLLEAQVGANFVRMSGSGASCFALFDSPEARDSAAGTIPFWHMASRIR